MTRANVARPADSVPSPPPPAAAGPDAGPSSSPPLRRGRRRLGLRARLGLVVLLGALPVIGALLLDASRERREVDAEIRRQLVLLVERAEQEQRQLASLAARELALWSLDPDVQRGDAARCEAALSRLARLSPDLVFPVRISAAGRVTCGGPTVAALGTDVSANPLFRHAMDTAGVVIGPYRQSGVLSEPLMPVNLRFTDVEGRPQGVLAVGVRMRWLMDLSTRSDLPAGTAITLLDETGMIIARVPDQGWSGRRIVGAISARRLREGRVGGIEEGSSLDGSAPRLVAYARMPGPPTPRFGVSASVPLESLTAGPDARLRRRLAVLAIALAVGLVAAWSATGAFVARDVAALASAAERIGTGDFTVRTGVRGAADEVQQLAEAIDQMAERLGEREERALRSQKLESIGRLAGGIAHDFNNLLTAISGNVEDVRDTLPLGSPDRESLDLALDATRRSGALTRQLLAFSRRESVQVTALALGPVLDETVQLLRRTLGATIRVNVRVAPGLAAMADRARLEQALLNLALNARDAMPDGGELRLDAIADAAGPPGGAPGRWVRLDVRDTGIGMSAEVQARLFEPFFTTKAVGKGTGLGLAMVYATMRQLGGGVSVASTPGVGTTFSLWMPAAELVATPTPVVPAPVTEAAAPSRGVGRVLLVDDEPGVRRLAARVLRRDGYDVIEAADGDEALQLVTSGLLDRLDVLVTDLVMPRVGGVALAQALRVRRPDLPVVLMTGFAGSSAPDVLLATPRTTLLEKPFEVSALRRAVATVRAPS